MDAIKKFLAKYSITTHSLAMTVATLVVLYNAVPAFHSLIVSAYAATPAWFHSIAAAVFGIWAFYQGSGKTS